MGEEAHLKQGCQTASPVGFESTGSFRQGDSQVSSYGIAGRVPVCFSEQATNVSSNRLMA